MDPTVSNSSIPILRNPPDQMLHGPNDNNYAAGAVQPHPIARLQQASSASSSSSAFLDLDGVRRLYGSAFAMRLATERSYAAQVGGRLPGIDANPTSKVMLETITGDDTSMDFVDYLNLEQNRPESARATRFGAHSAMESRLGL